MYRLVRERGGAGRSKEARGWGLLFNEIIQGKNKDRDSSSTIAIKPSITLLKINLIREKSVKEGGWVFRQNLDHFDFITFIIRLD